MPALFTNTWIAEPEYLLVIQIAGAFLGFWAILAMSRSKLNVTPVPLEASLLIMNGPYKVIRHPMYTSLMMMLLPMLSTNASLVNILVFIVFMGNQMLKMLYEEALLRVRFPEYVTYSEKTWRLLPWVF